MTGNGTFRPYTGRGPARVTSAGRPPWEEPPPSAPGPAPAEAPAPAPEQDPAAGSARSHRGAWWVLPFCGGVLAVIVVAATVIVIQHATRTPPAAGPTHAAAPTGPMPAEVFPKTLFSVLTQDIDNRNEAAFLRLTSARARPAMKT